MHTSTGENVGVTSRPRPAEQHTYNSILITDKQMRDLVLRIQHLVGDDGVMITEKIALGSGPNDLTSRERRTGKGHRHTLEVLGFRDGVD
jgi:hypothetical protein